jgi:hypothetical protein
MHSLYVDAGPNLFRDSHEIDDVRVRKFEVQILGARLILTRKRYNIGLLNRKNRSRDQRKREKQTSA